MNIGEANKHRITVKHGTKIQSLCWVGDELVDFAAGGTRYRLDGSIVPAHVFYAYHFDRAIVSHVGEDAVLFETLGTKALVLHRGNLVREINRSYYHAHVYEYPIAILRLMDGRTALVHCPESYNKLEIEELESGRKLTIRDGKSADFFHSRLAVSPDGKYLMSAGWVWHPLDAVQFYSITDALNQPTVLDRCEPLELPDELFEVHAGAFQDNHTAVLVGDNGGEPGEEGPFLVKYDLSTGHVISKTGLQTVAGTIMPVDSEHCLGFFQHPKLIETATGKIVHLWSELNSGKQNSSIVWKKENVPLLALDQKRKRFALADAEGITVVQLG